MKSQIISLLFFSVLITACNSGPSSNNQSSSTNSENQTAESTEETTLSAGKLKIGDMLPDFELETLAGETYRLHDLIDGDHFVAVIWHSPGCPCAAQCLDAVRSELSGPDYEDLKILGVASDPNMKVDWFRNDLQAQIDSGFVTFPIVLDHDQKIMDVYGAKRTPTVYMADKEGKIQFWGAPESSLYPGSDDHRILIKEALLDLREGKTPETQVYGPIGCKIMSASSDAETTDSDQDA